MGKMSFIADRLYLGQESDSLDIAQMKDNKISHVVRIDDEPEKTWRIPELNPTYLFVQAFDKPTQNIREHVSKVNEFVHKARLEGGTVLIHCFAGVSRSVSLTTTYLMTVTKFGFADVLRVVQDARSQANPISGFRKQLEEFEKQGLKEERERIRKCFNLKETDDPLGDNARVESRLKALKEKAKAK